MRIDILYEKYKSGEYKKVWEELLVIDYNSLTDNEKIWVLNIIKEALNRIDFNFKSVFTCYKDYGYSFINYGGLNTSNTNFLINNKIEFFSSIIDFYKTKSIDSWIPLFFACFCCYFKVVDFRGSFNFSNSLLLDSFFIESFRDHKEAENYLFKNEYNENEIESIMFSPDQFIKEDESGDIGPCIALNKSLKLEGIVVNYSKLFYFSDYLRFCFDWACMPNLFWASAEERRPFNNMINELKGSILPF